MKFDGHEMEPHRSAKCSYLDINYATIIVYQQCLFCTAFICKGSGYSQTMINKLKEFCIIVLVAQFLKILQNSSTEIIDASIYTLNTQLNSY